MNDKCSLRWVRVGGLYDLIVMAPLLTPWSFALTVQGLDAVNRLLGLPGQVLAPDPLHAMLASMLACLVLLWGWARWRHPSALLGRIDALTRVVFGLNLTAAAWQGQPALLLGYAAVEAFFLVAQLGCFRAASSDAAVLPCPSASRS